MGKRDRDFLLLAVASLLFALAYGMYYQLIYVYALSLGASRFAVGVLNAIVLFVAALCYLPGAWAAERYRLRAVIAVPWWLTVPAAAIFAFAPTWEWLIPGFVLSGAYMAANPALKAYIFLKSEPSRVASNITFVFGAAPIGMIISPLFSGFLADTIGMRAVFAIAAVIYAISAACASVIRDTPYHSAGTELSVRGLIHNRPFRRYIGFFLVAFLAVYVSQPFVSPYLAQVHGMDYALIGVLASVTALGAALLSQAMGPVTDRFGARASLGAVLAFLLAGVVLLLTGGSLWLWVPALFCYGAFDAFRYVAYAVSNRSFGRIPLAWGYGIFDALMGIPMAGGALLGGALYRDNFDGPFVMAGATCAALILALAIASAFGRRRTRLRPVRPED